MEIEGLNKTTLNNDVKYIIYKHLCKLKQIPSKLKKHIEIYDKIHEIKKIYKKIHDKEVRYNGVVYVDNIYYLYKLVYDIDLLIITSDELRRIQMLRNVVPYRNDIDNTIMKKWSLLNYKEMCELYDNTILQIT